MKIFKSSSDLVWPAAGEFIVYFFVVVVCFRMDFRTNLFGERLFDARASDRNLSHFPGSDGAMRGLMPSFGSFSVDGIMKTSRCSKHSAVEKSIVVSSRVLMPKNTSTSESLVARSKWLKFHHCWSWPLGADRVESVRRSLKRESFASTRTRTFSFVSTTASVPEPFWRELIVTDWNSAEYWLRKCRRTSLPMKSSEYQWIGRVGSWMEEDILCHKFCRVSNFIAKFFNVFFYMMLKKSVIASGNSSSTSVY